MKKLITLGCLALTFSAGAASAASPCGAVVIASMNWQSAEVLSNVDKIILSSGYGCQAEITVGDTVPTITSMAEKSQPDIAPEAWVDVMPDIVKKGVDNGKLVVAGASLSEGGESGWWIPKYMAEAHPEIKTIADALKRPDLFPHPDLPSKGAIFSGPQGWGGTVITAQLFKAYKAESAGFSMVDTGSGPALDASMARAYEKKQGWLGHYWAPSAMLTKYEMVKLEFGVPYDPAGWSTCITVADCPNPTPSAWPIDHVYTLVSTRFAKRAGPEVIKYLETRAWDNKTVGTLLEWMTENQASGEDAAKYFLKTYPEVWKPWVTPSAQSKVVSAL
ncbi:UNVERIFIED_ORG: glycine betaine/proline transport system substrate-binding protein [Pseudomonas lini]